MISSVKYQNSWFHDGNQHKFLRPSRRQRRQRRYARKPADTWRNWIKTTARIETASIPSRFVNSNSEYSRYYNTIETNFQQFSPSPSPIYIPTYKPWRWPVESVETNLQTTPYLRPIQQTTFRSVEPTAIPIYTRSTTRPPNVKKVRVQPGTIVMMNSTYLKEKYILTGLAKSYHRALLMDYFELSESEMDALNMSVVAWGFSYQVRDRPPARPEFVGHDFFQQAFFQIWPKKCIFACWFANYIC